MQKFGKINTIQLDKEIKELEEKIKTTNNYDEKLIILDKLLSYNKLLHNIAKKDEKFEIKYVKYNSYIEDLSKITEENFCSMTQYIKDNKILLKMMSNHINMFLNNKNLNKIDFNLDIISKDMMMDIIRDVFDKDFTDFLYNEINDNRVHFNTCKSVNLKKENYSGICLNLYDKHYYVIEKDKNFYYYNLFVLIHEISHGYINKEYNRDFTYNPFREVYSNYNELKLCKFLYDNKIGFKDCMLHDTFFFEELFSNSNSLYYWTYLIESVNKNGHVNENKFAQIIEQEKFSPNTLIEINLDEDDYFYTLVYYLGYTIALEQYYRYLYDSEKTEYIFNRLYNNNDDYTPFDYQLNILEINKKDLVTGKCVKQYFNEYQKRYVKK